MKSLKQKKIIVLTGPSGAGKTEMQNYLLENYSIDFCKFITSTTRPKRKTDKHKISYYFRQLLRFKRMIETKKFFEFEEVFPGGYYGCEYVELERILKSKKVPIIVADVKGALKFLGKVETDTIDLSKIEPIVFYIDCPITEMIERIKKDNESGKRNDTEEDLENRFKRMVFEINQKHHFDNIISNSGRHQHLTGNELVNEIFKKIKN